MFKELYREYLEAKSDHQLAWLNNPTPSNLKNCLIDFVNSTSLTSEQEGKIRAYIGKTDPKTNLKKEVSDIETTHFRTMSDFLKGINKTAKSTHGAGEVIRLLIDFEIEKHRSGEKILGEQEVDSKKAQSAISEETHTSKLSEEKINVTINNEFSPKNLVDYEKSSNHTLKWVLVVLSIVVFLFLVFQNDLVKSILKQGDKPPISINLQILNASDRTYPDDDTQFFDAEGQSLIWYSNYQGDWEFYNKNGLHPKTQEPLKPISKEIIETVIVEKEPVPTVDTIQLPKATTKIDKSKTLLNTDIINTPNTKELSVYVFDSKVLDNALTSRVKILLKTDYQITADIVPPSELSDSVITVLKSKNLNFFRGQLKNHIDYLAVGNVHYTYSPSKLMPNRIVCELSFEMQIIDVENGSVIDSHIKTISANANSERKSKTNAIEKLTL